MHLFNPLHHFLNFTKNHFMKITDKKLAIILKVIELSDHNALGQIHELIATKSSVPLSSIEKENVISALKDAESGRIPSRGGLFPDYL